MSRCPRPPAALLTALVLVLAGGCSRSTKSGERTNTGVLTGYELNDERDFQEGRRDRPDYRDFE